jgi:biofilm PGA synthesis N-glycosyltransferase PgaC
MGVVVLIIFGFYFISLLALLYGWEKALARPARTSTVYQSITVIVPMRNEERNVAQIIRSISHQNYPTDKRQVIFVNDHSTDNTAAIFSTNAPENFLLINLPESDSGKKIAITRGVELATGSIVVITDADCQHNPSWLQSISNQFEVPEIQMVVGPVAIQSNSFFSTLQAIEFSSLIGSGAALLQWGVPAMANGANMAFKREAFLKVNGYQDNEHIASGDDEFLLRKIHRAYPTGVRFNNDPTSAVRTEAQPSLRAFFQQRLRWASKWKHNTNWLSRVVAVAVFLFQVACVGLVIAVMICPNRPLQIMMFAKIAVDGIFLWRVSVFLKSKFSFLPFLLLEFVYPIYVIIIALLSQVFPYSWKGRKL